MYRETHNWAQRPGVLPSAGRFCCGFRAQRSSRKLVQPSLPPGSFSSYCHTKLHVLDKNMTQGPHQFSSFIPICPHKIKTLTILSYSSPFSSFLMKGEAPCQQTFKGRITSSDPPLASCFMDATTLDPEIPAASSWLPLKMYLLIN